RDVHRSRCTARLLKLLRPVLRADAVATAQGHRTKAHSRRPADRRNERIADAALVPQVVSRCLAVQIPAGPTRANDRERSPILATKTGSTHAGPSTRG